MEERNTFEAVPGIAVRSEDSGAMASGAFGLRFSLSDVISEEILY